MSLGDISAQILRADVPLENGVMHVSPSPSFGRVRPDAQQVVDQILLSPTSSRTASPSSVPAGPSGVANAGSSTTSSPSHAGSSASGTTKVFPANAIGSVSAARPIANVGFTGLGGALLLRIIRLLLLV